MDRRALFFLGAAVVVGLLIAVTDREIRWVPIGLAALYLVLALASYLDHRSRQSPTKRT
jgi:hypothetical protein